MGKRFTFGHRVFAGFIGVLILAMISCSLLVSRYINGFLREKTIEYNQRGMNTVVYELDNLYQRLEQFAAGAYITDLYSVMEQSGKATSYQSIRRQLEFEAAMKNSLLTHGLGEDAIGVLVYLDDDRHYYVGDGVFKRDFVISETDWYRTFAHANDEAVMVGPLLEDYRPYASTAQEVVLFITPLRTPANVASEKQPFVLLAVPYGSVAGYLDAFFGEGGGYVSNREGEIVYATGLGAEKSEAITTLRNNGALDTTDGYYDSELLVTSVYAPHYGWTLSAVNPSEEIFAESGRAVLTINLMFAACALVGGILAWVISRGVVVPIQTMNEMITQMEQDEDSFIEEGRTDEVGQIGTRFNAMKRRLQTMSGDMYLAEVRQKQAQLQALRAQINPHFLYNTMNNIHGMAQVHGVEEISDLIQNLSAMLRYSVDTAEGSSPLRDELRHVQQYIAILNARYDEGIAYKEAVDVALLELPVPKLLLQPIVENAWMHGISKSAARSGHITVAAELDGGCLRLVVTDDGIGMAPEVLKALGDSLAGVSPTIAESNQGFGIALRNVNDRVKLEQGEAYGIVVDSEPGVGTTVTVRLCIENIE